MNGKDDNIELRSEEFVEVLGNIPSWILQWGIYILGVFVLIALIGSSIFKYPDTVKTEMILTGTTPAVKIVTKSSGKLRELIVKDNDFVIAGSYLAVIENSANTKDVLLLKEYLRNSVFMIDSIIVLPPKGLNIGSIQALYSSFYNVLYEYNEFINQDYYSKKKEALEVRINGYRNYCKNIQNQRSILQEELNISNNQYSRDSILNAREVLSKEELENTKRGFLQSCLSVENVNATLKNAEIQIAQMKENLLDIDSEYRERKNSLVTQLKTYMNQLLAEIQTWEMTYVFVAPIDGIISFTRYWVENQNVITGEVVLNIVPTGPVRLLGKAVLPMIRSGKVKIGQKVIIHFDSFPDNEFGNVHGVVHNISLIPSKGSNEENGYIVEIEFPNGLKTTYNIDLPYMPEMEAKAYIVTEDLSLLERFVFPIKKILNEAMK